MGWVSKVKVDEPEHVCYKPTLMNVIKDYAAPGSVWECPKCRRRYLYTGAIAGVTQWEEGKSI